MSRHGESYTGTLTKVTPPEYITSVRVNAAKTLLGTTDRRVADIASEVGFFDHAHFIRTFKRIVGVTPAIYRRDIILPPRTIRQTGSAARSC